MSEKTAAEKHARVKEIFLEVVACAENERASYLVRACAGDVELLREVQSLLGHHVPMPLLFDEATVPERPGSPASPVPAAAPVASINDPLGLIGVTLDDRYRIEAFVAEGGFGYVYRAVHLRWNRPVAVKIFKTVGTAEMQDELREAFVKEGALLNELSRKTTAIAQSYDVGSWTRPNGPPLVFTVLEWLQGRSLSEALGKPPRTPWTIEQVIETITPVADALAVAHSSGVAHRDVKPRNIFLVEETGSPAVKLLDFGAAKVAADYPQGFLGTGGLTTITASYAAPEQYIKKYGSTGPWTDVYSLALLCVELMLGKHPQELGVGFGPASPPTPLRAGVHVSAQVEAVFQRALSAEPSARFRDAAEFWRAFVDAARAPPPKPKTRWALWIALAAGAALITVLAAVLR